jgi:hypothetical protein
LTPGAARLHIRDQDAPGRSQSEPCHAMHSRGGTLTARSRG